MPHWRESVVLLTSTDPDNSGFGTGFVFHRDSTGRCFLLTCLHVVATLEKPGKGGAGEPPGILAADKPAEVWVRGDSVLDLAVLAVDGLGLEPLRLGSQVLRGTPIETAGFSDFEKAQGTVVPRPLQGTVRDNNPVWSRRPKARQRAWSLDIEIDEEAFRALAEGYSGSPVVDPATDAVIGIMNLKWSGTKGHALCVRSCDLLDPPLARRLPDYPPPATAPATLVSTQAPRPAAPAAPAAAAGGLDWLASTLDHTDPIARVADRLGNGSVGPHPGPWFYAFEACHADCPRTLAEHLALRLAGRDRGAPRNDDLITVLEPLGYGERGLWNALVETLTPRGAGPEGRGEQADRILSWLKDTPVGAVRVVYCQLVLAVQGARIAEFITGAVQSFGGLQGLAPNTRVLFLFGCIYEESGFWARLLNALRRPRLAPTQVCEPLGTLGKLSLMDLDAWLGKVAETEVRGWYLDAQTRKRLRDALEPLFPNDAARLRYKRLRRPALDILAQATLVAATPGDPP